MPLIKLYASFRKLAGKKEVTVQGSSIQDVLERLARDFPTLQRFLLEDGHLRPRLIITINGQILDPATGLQIPVNERDEIAIFPPIAGG